MGLLEDSNVEWKTVYAQGAIKSVECSETVAMVTVQCIREALRVTDVYCTH